MADKAHQLKTIISLESQTEVDVDKGQCSFAINVFVQGTIPFHSTSPPQKSTLQGRPDLVFH